MSLLWKGKKILNLLILFQRPSPKHKKHIPCFAQSNIPYLKKNEPVYSWFSRLKICHSIKGIPRLISSGKSLEGSMTVEACIVLPLFFFFFLNIGGAIEMIRLHGNLELALWDVGNRMTVYGHMLTSESEAVDGQSEHGGQQGFREQQGSQDGQNRQEDSLWVELAGVALSGTYVKGQIIDYLGETYLDNSPLKEGADSLLFLESDVYETDDTFEIVVTYAVSPVNSLAGHHSFRMANKYYGHFWNGYEIPADTDESEQYAYVTENGQVYHLKDTCTHLKLSVAQVSYPEAVSSRNETGDEYTACEKCCDGITLGSVYITSEGNRYHYKRECPGLKRTIYYVPISQVQDYRICSRCAE